jgi:predicted GH43/DUF377 family glycosyl hydrolase
MNKRRRFFIFTRLGMLVLLLTAVLAATWIVHAGTSADPFLPGAWTKLPGNPVLSTAATYVFSPSVILDGSTYKMWYTIKPTGTKMSIVYLTSSNATTWNGSDAVPVLPPGNPGSWDANGVSYPTVIKEDATHYKMWYTGVDASSIGRVGYATSFDGTNWTKSGSYVLDVGSAGSWDSAYVGQTSVIKVGANYQIWYRGASATGGAIGYATSSNGLNWSKHDPAITGGSGGWDATPYHPEVIFDGTGYHMWYSGSSDQAPEIGQVGYATSSDGAHWTRKGLVLPQGSAGAWDDESADNAAVLQVGSTLKMWYSGYDGATYQIGYASAPATILDHRVYLPAVIK